MNTILWLGWLILAADEKVQLPDAPGKAVTLKVCNNCHGAEIVIGRPHSKDGWEAIVADMVQRGAEGTDDEFDQVVEYLTKNIKAGPPAKINVNTAAAKALVAGLGLTEKEAGAIVQAREKGTFKTIDDLKKVSGVDPAKIESKKDRISLE